ncbi:MAG TPA: hypothetical protein VLM38_03710 [Blastocatellia bacterium]|nr:hypothetical protein [Blastocatellia bacterium]
MKRSAASFFFLLMLALQAAASRPDDKQALTAAEIINKHLEAVGGKTALSKLKTRVAVGSVRKESEPDADVAIMSEAPNRVSAMYVFKDYTWQLTFDGSKSLFRPLVSKEASVVEAKQREMVATGAMFNSISLYNLLTQAGPDEFKFEAKGTKKVKGRPAYAVDVKRAKLPTLRLYFDTETFMWVRTDFGSVSYTKEMGTFTNQITQHGEDQTDVDFYFETSDFREVDGVKLPYKFEQVVAFPIIRQKKAGTIIGMIKEYRHNVPIDPKMFQ